MATEDEWGKIVTWLPPHSRTLDCLSGVKTAITWDRQVGVFRFPAYPLGLHISLLLTHWYPPTSLEMHIISKSFLSHVFPQKG
jgi:hypothetical protein